MYEADGVVTSMGTISDVKSHMADATWASLSVMLENCDLSTCKTLYIISDSPTSQCRNKKCIFLIKQWAVKNGIDVIWVFTETGHGKGPMDGVGAAIKSKVKDTISYVIHRSWSIFSKHGSTNIDLYRY